MYMNELIVYGTDIYVDLKICRLADFYPKMLLLSNMTFLYPAS